MTTSFKFGKSSTRRLLTCAPKLQELMHEVLKRSKVDVSILCGNRSEEDQMKAYNAGNSTVKYPNSKHNSMPSMAVDIAPYPIDWDNIDRFKELSKVVFDCAHDLDIKVEWGGNWNSFKDYPHYQLC